MCVGVCMMQSELVREKCKFMKPAQHEKTSNTENNMGLYV